MGSRSANHEEVLGVSGQILRWEATQPEGRPLIAAPGRAPSRCWTVVLGDTSIQADTPAVETDRAGSKIGDWRECPALLGCEGPGTAAKLPGSTAVSKRCTQPSDGDRLRSRHRLCGLHSEGRTLTLVHWAITLESGRVERLSTSTASCLNSTATGPHRSRPRLGCPSGVILTAIRAVLPVFTFKHQCGAWPLPLAPRHRYRAFPPSREPPSPSTVRRRRLRRGERGARAAYGASPAEGPLDTVPGGLSRRIVPLADNTCFQPEVGESPDAVHQYGEDEENRRPRESRIADSSAAFAGITYRWPLLRSARTNTGSLSSACVPRPPVDRSRERDSPSRTRSLSPAVTGSSSISTGQSNWSRGASSGRLVLTNRVRIGRDLLVNQISRRHGLKGTNSKPFRNRRPVRRRQDVARSRT
jgi:hypothetical protein